MRVTSGDLLQRGDFPVHLSCPQASIELTLLIVQGPYKIHFDNHSSQITMMKYVEIGMMLVGAILTLTIIKALPHALSTTASPLVLRTCQSFPETHTLINWFGIVSQPSPSDAAGHDE